MANGGSDTNKRVGCERFGLRIGQMVGLERDIDALRDDPIAEIAHLFGAFEHTDWSKETGARTFDILVNDTIVGTQTLDGNHPESFYDVAYPIPPEFTKDGKVTVTSKPHQDNTAGGVFGVRTIR